MKSDGLENVHTEAVKVPHWVRGRESLEIAGPIPQPLVMLGLGNSVGTPAAGIEAELLVVHTFEELDAAKDRVKGRIVLFNVPFTNYGDTVRFRAPGRRARPRSAPSRCSSAPSAPPVCARRTPARSPTPTASRRFPRRR